MARVAAVLLLLGTAVHGGARWLNSRRRLAPTVRVAAVVVAMIHTLGAAGLAMAAPAGPRALDAPTAAQQMGNPLAFAETLLEMTSRAEAATARGDHLAAAALYGEVSKAVPDSAYAFARRCDALEAAGKLDAAIEACRTALTRRGIKAGDFTDFVRLLLTKPTGLTDVDRRQLSLVVDELARDPRAAATAARLRCNVAVHERDLAALSACSAALAQAEPDDPRTISFQWALAYERRQAIASALLLRRARQSGVEATVVDRMAAATRELTVRLVVRVVEWSLGAAVLFVIVFVAGRLVVGWLGRRQRDHGGDDTSVQRNPVGT